MAAITVSQAIQTVEDFCGGLTGFHLAWEFIGDAWERNLEALCHKRQTPEEYVKNAREMFIKFREHEFNQDFEEILVNTRGRQ